MLPVIEKHTNNNASAMEHHEESMQAFAADSSVSLPAADFV